MTSTVIARNMVVPGAFLVLDNCDVYVAREEEDNDDCYRDDTNPWFAVDVTSSRDVVSHKNSFADRVKVEDHCSSDYCVQCRLIVEEVPSLGHRQQLKILTQMDVNNATLDKNNGDPISQGKTSFVNIPRYDGTIHDTKCNYCSRSWNGDQHKRSDAALLIGLALTSQDYSHIDVQSIKIGFYSSNGRHDSGNNESIRFAKMNQSSCEKNHYRYYRKEKACILITFSCREILASELQPPRSNNRLGNHQVGKQRRRFFAQSIKQLPAATQLILSIMNSNWEEYDARIAELSSSRLATGDEHLYNGKKNSQKVNEGNSISRENHTSQTDQSQRYQYNSKITCFFPSKMNLEHVFQRINGVSSSFNFFDASMHSEEIGDQIDIPSNLRHTANGDKADCGRSMSQKESFDIITMNAKTTTTTIHLTALSRDILCHHIGQYLRAKSLDALRCTCKYLFFTLRAVIPGLKLDLYFHQINSLLWMRRRETKQIAEEDLLRGDRRRRLDQHKNAQQGRRQSCQGTTSQWTFVDGDTHRAATGGGTVILCTKPCQVRQDANLRFPDMEPVRISQLDHGEVQDQDNVVRTDHENYLDRGIRNPLSRRVARGGLLCDDPGLGKTITVISLILQTLGLSTEKEGLNNEFGGVLNPGNNVEHIIDPEKEQDKTNCEPVERKITFRACHTLSPMNEQIFEAYWKEQVVPEYRGRAMLKLYSGFLRSSGDVNLFYDNYWLSTLQPKDTKAIRSCISLKDVRLRISNYYVYEDSLHQFVSDVECCFQNAVLCTAASDLIREAATRLLLTFHNQVVEFKQSQIEVAMKSFSRAAAKPESIVAALVERAHSEKLKSVLLSSAATLLVVPVVLVDHWMHQLKRNINVSYCTNKIPLVFEYNGNHKSESRREEVTLKCRVQKTHFPFIFVDRSATKQLPAPSFLAMFKVVITTNNRFSCEWKNGSFEDEMRRSRNQNRRSNANSKYTDIHEDLATSEEACPLLKVNWLRMVVDEGHSMGRSRDNSSISFASWINAERRWAMTGTPTPQTSTDSGLMNIFNLMQYLQHDFFTRRGNGDNIWKQLIVRGWNRGFASSFFRLRSLLALLMIRHIKSDILELPLPVFNTNILPMGFEEVSTYNTLVCAVQSNLLITSMKGRTSGAQDSLLHKSQIKFAREAIRNLRLVCAGGTQVRPTLTAEYWAEFHQDFDNVNFDPIQRNSVRNFIARATSGQRSKCDCCSIMLSTLLVFPCGHLVCTECVDSNTTSCVICDNVFDVDIFQKLQPGFMYDWLHNLENDMNRRETDRDRKQRNGGESTDLPNGEGILIPHNQRQRRARTRKFGDGHTCEYDPKDSNGKCILCFSEHEPCFLVGKQRCEICFRLTENCPTSESKITHIIDKLLVLHKQQQEMERSVTYSQNHLCDDSGFISERRIPKVIIFSQFRPVLNVTGDRLLRRFGSGHISEYWGQYRKKELNKFIKDDRCLCMLLGKDGSEGLDLSFVTHIIFLEKVWDKSLENQVVARAWRMGAKGSVSVETLIAESSIEENMFLLENKVDYGQGGGSSRSTSVQKLRSTAKDKNPEFQQAKLHYLLKNLKLITGTTTQGFGSGVKNNKCFEMESSLKRDCPETDRVGTSTKAKKRRIRFQI